MVVGLKEGSSVHVVVVEKRRRYKQLCNCSEPQSHCNLQVSHQQGSTLSHVRLMIYIDAITVDTSKDMQWAMS